MVLNADQSANILGIIPASNCLDIDGTLSVGGTNLKSDSVVLTKTIKSIECVTTAGNIKFVTAGGQTMTLPFVVGQRRDIVITQVYSTLTTAVGILGYYDKA